MNEFKSRYLLFIGVFPALGLIISALIIGATLRDIRTLDRVVTVKGLVERDVVANIAVWPLELSTASNNLTDAQTQLESGIGKIKAFLLEKGFTEEDITLSPIRVFDRKTQEYGGQNIDQLRYIVQSAINLRSSHVALVQKVSRMTNELVRAGVTLSQQNTGCRGGPLYLFTQLNEVKPQMLAEATKNARKAAEQFAADSESQVGKIKRAYQGSFSIDERDSVNLNSEGSYGPCSSEPNKKLRVVTTIEYYLD